MYQKLKQILKTFIPVNLLFKYELFFRFFYYPFYRGKKYQCNICKRSLGKFIELNNANLICPSCGSAPRNRRLWSIFKTDFLKENLKVLHFSPSRSLYREFKKESAINYSSSDFAGEFFADKKLDITNIEEDDNSYDLIICFHVLEHIENDKKAISELFRILKPAGTCIIQTPFKDGDIYEDPSIKSEQQRLSHFGQADHVRIYSAQGLRDRLLAAGFNVEIKKFKEEEDNFFGYKQSEFVIIAQK